MTLKYVPAGFTIQAIPARDLTDEEVEQWGEEYLLATGLYVREEIKLDITFENDGIATAETKPFVYDDTKHLQATGKTKRKSKKASKEVSKG
jgi:hypothetical protein